ncbi:MAG TPA: aspartate-semialdehyde dehydrogenase [Bacilli bacterium]|jgi:aspartate-semialdehyde dehydrogenase|nr:aspartate-semialdehyde dehydrogenase [Acholeplasmataceae bacterium]HNZ77926.1 aspartate-semialdehyde dehydrogenase [Bacilli bacterium]HOD61477.1 aspartate-semialdehyde dehydrogenase [Bacilli bacterium]HOH61473.1 aspartate-semialdehyde dehydrogenase [Bacilli bacterium]HPB49468.1 aspartate-semialdehyde dehydrogenase [Bacilli bacterium]
MKKYNVAIVGATGLVGGTFLKVLAEYQFPIKNLRLLASSKSAGTIINYCGKKCVVEELTEKSFKGIDIALFSAGGEISKIYCPIAAQSGAVVIDNSSAWRNDPSVPLVVPEVNAKDIRNKGIISNPNCSTTQAIIPLKALDDRYGLKRVVFSTYQAVSGSGMKGVNDLERTLKGEKNEFYPYEIAKTCIPEIDSFLENGYTKEEMKMVNETRKMLHKPELPISATCIRVPVPNSHGVSIMAELNQEFKIEDVKELFANYPGLKLVDKPLEHLYPTSTIANGNDFIYVGRIRRDLSSPNGILFYTVSDNIRKGAASNAVQIAKYIVENEML